MRVLLLLPYAWNTTPSQRFRIEQWTPYLRSQGVSVDVFSLIDPSQQKALYSAGNTGGKARLMLRCMVRRLLEVRKVSQYDLIWLHRAAWPVGPALPERMLARRRVPILFEFDDAIYMNHTSAANQRFKALKWAGKTGEICALSRHVVVGNEFLAQYARGFSSNVTIIPTTIDTDDYTPGAPRPSADPVTIGWSGSGTTVAHLRTLNGVLQAVARQCSIRLQVIGTDQFELEGVNCSARAWRPETQVEELRRFDVGVMPLPDEDWARGKCALKALEYMAMELPTVTSPVGVNADIIQDGVNGMLATTHDEWVERLVRLVKEPELRARLGKAGRQTVMDSYSTRTVAPDVLKLLRTVHAEAQANGKKERLA